MNEMATELQIGTIVSNILSGRLNLTPDFQRGEVWSTAKKQKLIDSIIRGWKIPPIHVVKFDDKENDEVLDGQQRLTAIRDFYTNKFPIDGLIMPYNQMLYELNGLFFSDLPNKIKFLFIEYSIIFITLTNFEPSEPAELFERLNQPTHLTSAEKRNAYVGETRNQIKHLVDIFIEEGASEETIGFSNSRLAYDEIIAKFCYAIEIRTLRKKILASDISNRYRYNELFFSSTIQSCQDVLLRFMRIIRQCNSFRYHRIKVNKATIYSWFIFIRNNPTLSDNDITQIMLSFESMRDYIKGKINANSYTYSVLSEEYTYRKSFFPTLEQLVTIFNQKASIGSTDAISIIYRDIILYIYSRYEMQITNDIIIRAFETISNDTNVLNALLYIYHNYRWGEEF